MSEIVIKQVRSGIGTIPKQRATLKALGLRRINHVVTKQDTVQVRGMVKRVSHLVEIVS
ncbi:MAG: 50S ribosomal protein L30 [Chloroflexi bacterium]|nr:50S ribosomal protein L30 [Chloroflexota bacterium]